MRKFINKVKAQVSAREEGQGTVEYAVVLGVIVVAVVGLFNATPLGASMTALINNITTLI